MAHPRREFLTEWRAFVGRRRLTREELAGWQAAPRGRRTLGHSCWGLTVHILSRVAPVDGPLSSDYENRARQANCETRNCHGYCQWP